MTASPNRSSDVRPNVLRGETVPNMLGGHVPGGPAVRIHLPAVRIDRPGTRLVTAVVLFLLAIAFVVIRG
jgi:hypothetical protein